MNIISLLKLLSFYIDRNKLESHWNPIRSVFTVRLSDLYNLLNSTLVRNLCLKLSEYGTLFVRVRYTRPIFLLMAIIMLQWRLILKRYFDTND